MAAKTMGWGPFDLVQTQLLLPATTGKFLILLSLFSKSAISCKMKKYSITSGHENLQREKKDISFHRPLFKSNHWKKERYQYGERWWLCQGKGQMTFVVFRQCPLQFLLSESCC